MSNIAASNVRFLVLTKPRFSQLVLKSKSQRRLRRVASHGSGIPYRGDRSAPFAVPAQRTAMRHSAAQKRNQLTPPHGFLPFDWGIVTFCGNRMAGSLRPCPMAVGSLTSAAGQSRLFDRGSTSFHFRCAPKPDIDSTLRGKALTVRQAVDMLHHWPILLCKTSFESLHAFRDLLGESLRLSHDPASRIEQTQASSNVLHFVQALHSSSFTFNYQFPWLNHVRRPEWLRHKGSARLAA